MDWPEMVIRLIPQPALVAAGFVVFGLYLLAWRRDRIVSGPYLVALAFSFLPLAVFYALALAGGYVDQQTAVAASRLAFAVLFAAQTAVGLAIQRDCRGC